MKKARATRDYGLPPLTYEEAAYVLSIRPSEFREWLEARVDFTPQMRANWMKRGREAGLAVPILPESLIRLYLTQRLGGAMAIRLPATPEIVAESPHRVKERRRQK